ncbi:hypothetical protein QO001_006271 [Methylobacterium brachiatum]|jgi:hypothetical protein|uniref:Uncharacterized protein n=1 Tax=Methylobacterium brachiatum TaxID=269660 RepID=A0AAJ1TU89_9HYPH|nr:MULTISPECIES: hypothetical protein [Methylobacterium]MCB4806220.1 hypothetical protein [Methylobacterium brachiatum]MDQ0547312.1 hypothetical protein [Methylobacterium brachiatum]SFV12310.1 hypothetical protein SAMN02799643_05666 [Methylobacterium sp. UNCCL125]
MTGTQANDQAAEWAARLTKGCAITATPKPTYAQLEELRHDLYTVADRLLVLNVPSESWPGSLNLTIEDWEARQSLTCHRVAAVQVNSGYFKMSPTYYSIINRHFEL